MQRPRTTNRNTWIPDDHLEKIIAQLGAEDRCIIALALQTGYRIDDLLSLRWDALIGTTITAIEAKTGKLRSHALSGPAVEALGQLREIVRDRKGSQNYIIPSRRGRAGDKPTLSRWSIWRAFKRAVSDAGLTGCGYTIHSLRKVYAWRLFRATGSIAAVQRDLNHDRIETTFLYLQEPMEIAARAPDSGLLHDEKTQFRQV